jgi:hypothetical protein
MPGNSIGERYWGGIIELESPGGKITRAFRNSYLVAEGAVTVAATKMNVFYIGVDNPIDVSVAGVPPENVTIEVTNARKKRVRNSYIVNPRRPGNCWFRYMPIWVMGESRWEDANSGLRKYRTLLQK